MEIVYMIKAGDVVQLKSGGPRMTVVKLETTDHGVSAYCNWFEGKTPKSGSFPIVVLVQA
jgi:uncharacterized protein YodC (DUF2158 family)